MILRSCRRLLLSLKPVAAVRAQPPQVSTTSHYCNNANLGSFFGRHVTKPAAVCRSPARLPGRSYTTSQPIDSRTRWFRNPLKIASVAALVSGATAIAVYRPYLKLEIVPYTNRAHVVYLSPQSERELWGHRHDEDMKKWAAESRIVDPLHPDSVRVRLIAEKIIRAAHCTLGIHSHDDKTRRTKSRNASALQPHSGHLRELEWGVILVKDELPNASGTARGKIVVFTGLLDLLKTDAEIAFALGHEVGHIIARHDAEIFHHKWFPELFLVPFYRRIEIEADHIGLLLLSAAGFHPYTSLIARWKLAKSVTETILEAFLSPYPSYKRISQYLLQPKVMQKAMELYNEVTTDQDVGNKSA